MQERNIKREKQKHTIKTKQLKIRQVEANSEKQQNRGQKFHSSARNYEGNLERTSNSSQSTRPVGRVLWEELLEEVKLHITPLCSLLHTLLKDKCTCLQDE